MMSGSLPTVAIARILARGLSALLLDVFLGREQDGRRAVDDAARVAGGVQVVDGFGLRVFGERDLIERLALGTDRRPRPAGRTTASRPASSSAVVPGRGNSSRSSSDGAGHGILHGEERLREAALFDGARGVLLRAQGERVELFAARSPPAWR